MIDLLTIGDADIDLYMKIADNNELSGTDMNGEPRICFYHGTKIPVEHFETAIAGNSLNVGVSCTQLGLKTALYTELGDDSDGQRIISELQERGVDTRYCVKNSGKPTNVHSVIVYGGERTIFSYHERRNYKVMDWETPKWIYYSSMGYGFEEFQCQLMSYFKSPKGKDVGVAFNPGTIQLKEGLESFKEFLGYTDVLFLNMEEAQNMLGKYDIKRLHDELHKLGVKLSVITEGKDGASASDGCMLVHVPIYSDERPILDKTGAGDAFAAGFLAAVFYGKNIKEALQWGAINSGSCVKAIGATKGILTKTAIEETVKGLCCVQDKANTHYGIHQRGTKEKEAVTPC